MTAPMQPRVRAQPVSRLARLLRSGPPARIASGKNNSRRRVQGLRVGGAWVVGSACFKKLEILMKRNGIHPLELIRMSLYLNELVNCGMRGESVTHEFARNATDDQYLLLNLVNVKTKNDKREWNHSPVER